METLFHINTNTETEIYYEKDKSIFWPIYFIHRERAITLDCVVDFGIFFFCSAIDQNEIGFLYFPLCFTTI